MIDVKRNGKIELMRFVFCLVIILYHINNRIEIKMPDHLTFFANGKIGVEFFFIVSGYLMAAAAKKHYNIKNYVEQTTKFIYKKFMGIFPYHLIVFASTLILYFIIVPINGLEKRFERFISFLPGFFFLQKSGIYFKNFLSVEWYIAAMLITMLILYPLILTYKDKFTKIVCPLIAILLIGYMAHANNQLGGMNKFLFSDIVSKAYIRAFAEMACGVFGYEVVAHLKKLKFNKVDRLILTIIEFVCYILPIIYTFSDWKTKYEPYAFYSLAIAVILSFSEVTYFNKLLKNKAVYFLGKISLPLYLCQNIPLYIITFVLNDTDWRIREKIVFTLISCMVLSVILLYTGNALKKAIDRKIKYLKN